MSTTTIIPNRTNTSPAATVPAMTGVEFDVSELVDDVSGMDSVGDDDVVEIERLCEARVVDLLDGCDVEVDMSDVVVAVVLDPASSSTASESHE